MLAYRRTWRTAWVAAAYGPGGFWTRERPGDHFRTGVGVGPLVAGAVARLAGPGTTVVDVGAGDGELLAHLADLLPGVRLVGVDRRERPVGLPSRVGWFTDHWSVDRGSWDLGPRTWLAGTDESPLLVAHEWLDDLPVAVVGKVPGGWAEVEVDRAGAEQTGPVVGAEDAGWLARWWPTGDRAEVGRPRDEAWAALVAAAVARGGRALAIDYGHVAGDRPAGGSLTAYAHGRQRRPVPDGSVNLTAGVAVDALAAAGVAVGARTLLLARQAAVLGAAPTVGREGLAGLVRRSEHAALTAPHRWGDLWWLLQVADTSKARGSP